MPLSGGTGRTNPLDCRLQVGSDSFLPNGSVLAGVDQKVTSTGSPAVASPLILMGLEGSYEAQNSCFRSPREGRRNLHGVPAAISLAIEANLPFENEFYRG